MALPRFRISGSRAAFFCRVNIALARKIIMTAAKIAATRFFAFAQETGVAFRVTVALVLAAPKASPGPGEAAEHLLRGGY